MSQQRTHIKSAKEKFVEIQTQASVIFFQKVPQDALHSVRVTLAED